MAQRVTLRKRQPYNTKSSRRRVVKTPGGILRYHHIKKLATAPKCGDCGNKLSGVVALRPREYATVSKTQKHVNRAYGGSRCGDCVRSRYVLFYPQLVHSVACAPLRLWIIDLTTHIRVVRAFLIEEAKIVKRVIKSQQKGGR
ncbi:60s ribosomal protein l34-b [Amylostereum chailletii]|nr:60s ribosomal protein l34-b [Amylostereum chailletii]